ncbi:hypothetical protein OK016_29535 [Vibrio chagasii]|nr:hypothetical protein [Vibrio chagasii]
MSIPLLCNLPTHMFEIKGTYITGRSAYSNRWCIRRGTIKRALLPILAGNIVSPTCGGAGIVIACAVGDYGELVMRFAGITTIPVFSGSSYIDERFFDVFEKGKQIELLQIIRGITSAACFTMR